MTIAHITISSRSRRALARTEAERRALIRALAQVAGEHLLLFNLVDDHLHVVVRGAYPRRIADIVRRVVRARRPDLVIKPPHVEVVEGTDYLLTLVRYVLRQTDRHELAGVTGPAMALWTGSCVQDLLLVRLLPGFDATPLRSELPRLNQRVLLELVGLPATPIQLADDEALSRLGPARIAELAAEVHVADPALTDKSAATVKARALATHVARLVDLPTRSIVRYLGVGLRAVELLAHRPVEPREVLALRRRVTLDARVALAPRPSVQV